MNIFRTPGGRLGLLFVSSLSFMLASQPGVGRASEINWNHSNPSNTELSGIGLSGIGLSGTGLSGKSSSDAFTLHSDAPFQISEGEGGEFNYQIWQNLNRDEYYLFIWDQHHDDNDEPAASYNFNSAAAAQSFFTCRYARERLASCNMMVASVSYDIPETCVFPWANCD